ncbi:MAG: hypothetical protein HYY42_00310 [Chloroflexi bacterium]|nr:hypothetical protein [Chloroflexota bacterium]
MSEEPGTQPVGDEPGTEPVREEPGTGLMTTPEEAIPAQRARGSPAPAIFIGSMLAALLVLGPAILVLSGVGRTAAEPEPTSTPSVATVRPAATAAPGAAQRTAAPAGGPIRVLSTSGSAAPQAGGGGYQVTFIWVLEGAREGDPIKIQFYAASRMLAEREGTLEPQLYTFSTGTLRITTTQECSPSGWQADRVGVRGQAPAGETLASVAGVACR